MKKEWQFFFASIFYGSLLMTIYDILRGLRSVWRHSRVLIGTEDMVFWFVSGIFLFTRAYHWNWGQIRWYFLAGIGLGMLLYAVTISQIFLKVVSFLLKRLKMFFSWGNIILKQFVRLWKMILRFLRIRNGKNVKTKKETNPDEQDQWSK